MATHDIKSVTIRPDGWSADVVIEGWSGKSGTVSYDWGTLDDDPATTSSPIFTLTVVSEGYNASGVLGTTPRTVYGTKVVRQPYPNEASLDETDSGSDLSVRIALSDCIYNDDKNGGAGTSGTDPVVTVSAGWANDGTNDNNAVTSLTCTNNSTLDYPSVIGQWDWLVTPAWKRVESAFNMAFRARHGFGIAAVTLSATGGTSAHVESGTATVITKQGPEQNGLYHESYNLSVPLTSFTQGEKITLKAIAYPSVGDADSIIDTSTNTAATDHIRGLTEISCQCDKTGALKSYGVVTTTGDDGTGVVSTTLATAEASPYATIGGALADGATVVYVRTGTHDILGANPASVTALDYYIEVRPHPSDTVSGITLNRGGSFLTYKAAYLAYIGFTGEITYSAGNGWLDGEAGARQVLFDGCTFNSSATPTTGLGYRSNGCWFISCTGMGTDDYDSFSSARVAYSFNGCTFSSAADPVWFSIIACSANTNKAELRVREKSSTNIAPAQNNAMFEHNRFVNLDTNANSVFRYGELSALSGLSVVGNVIECSQNTTTQPIFWIGGDSSTADLKNVILAHNTAAGNRCNLFYNDVGTTANVRENIFCVGNAFQSYNIKSDLFGTPSGNRVGNWAQLYGVGFKDNRYDGTASSSFVNEYDGINGDYVTAKDSVYGQMGYTDEASVDGTGLGDGDYTPTTGSVLLSHTLISPVYSYDLKGNTVNTEIGALQIQVSDGSSWVRIGLDLSIRL